MILITFCTRHNLRKFFKQVWIIYNEDEGRLESVFTLLHLVSHRKLQILPAKMMVAMILFLTWNCQGYLVKVNGMKWHLNCAPNHDMPSEATLKHEKRRADLRYATIAVSSTGADQGVCADQGLRIPDHLQLRPNEIADLWTLSQ